jgi:hypothetical protein
MHSPSPWKITDSSLPDVLASDGTVVVWTVDGSYGSQIEANARLISAAPDLLAACKVALNDLASPDSLRQILEGAINKAEGKEK